MSTGRTEARASTGEDAFDAIAKRMLAVRAPVDSVLAIADKLPAGEQFKAFALALAAATAAFEAYLVTDAQLMALRTGALAQALAEAGPVQPLGVK